MKKFSNWLIRLLCPPHLLEDLLGDIEEQYEDNLEKHPKLTANWLLFKDTLSLVNSYAIRKRKYDASFHPYSSSGYNFGIIRNYIKVAVRSIKSQKFFTGVNILGLSAGMSIGILFITIISFVKTYDNFHINKDNIYRVISYTDDKVKNRTLASSPGPLAEILNEKQFGFGEVVRINKSLKTDAEYGRKELPLSGYFVDNNFLDVFSFDMKEGGKSLDDPFGIWITESYATKLSFNKNPIGETIHLKNMGDFTIKGILKDIPKNSHMWFEALVPYQALERLSNNNLQSNINEWENFLGNYTYLMLPENSNIDNLTNSLSTIAEEKYELINQIDVAFKLQPLANIALGQDTSNELGTAWGIEIYLIGIFVTMLILVPACFNYANISTARALHRAKEIGIRKVVGGLKKQIFLQFIIETVIISLISLLGALVIFTLIRSEFQSMLVLGKTSLDFQITTTNLLYSVVFAILTGILAGIFPAIHFAGIKPLSALKKSAKSKVIGKVNVQKTLLVVQFALSFGFIMGIIVIVDQYKAVMNHDLGFTKENIIDIEIQDTKPEILYTSLNQLAEVQELSMSSSILGVNSNEGIWLPLKDDSILVTQIFVDYNYLKNFNLELIAGKNFDKSNTANEQFVIVNESFLKKTGFESAGSSLGETVAINDSSLLRIKGVVKDFHFQNLRQKIGPFILRNNAENFRYANAKIMSSDVSASLDKIDNEWKKLSGLKLKAKFFSHEIEAAFNVYSSVIKIFLFLGFLAITISCLGLLSMVVFNTQNRTKEVGIRKVMGASSFNLTMFLTKDYMKLILIGSAISIPISYFLFTVVIDQQNAYSTGIGVLPVVISLLIIIVLGLSTVITETWKVSNLNPTDTLRSE